MNYGQVYTLWKTNIQIPLSYSFENQNKCSLKLLTFSVGIVLNSAVLVIAGRQSMRWVSMSFVWVQICGEVADSLAMSFTLLCGRVISLPCPYFVFRYTSRKDIAGQGF